MNPAVEVYLFICEHYFQSITFLVFIGFIVFIYIFKQYALTSCIFGVFLKIDDEVEKTGFVKLGQSGHSGMERLKDWLYWGSDVTESSHTQILPKCNAVTFVYSTFCTSA